MFSGTQQDNFLIAQLNGFQIENSSARFQAQLGLNTLEQLILRAITLQQTRVRKAKIDQVLQKVQKKVKSLKHFAYVFRGNAYLSIAKLMQILPEMMNDHLSLQTMNGLIENQQKIWKSYKQGSINQVQTSDIDKVLNQQELISQRTQQYMIAQQKIQMFLNHFNQQIKLLKTSIQDNVNLIYFKESTILKSNQDIQKLTKLLDKKIRKAELLYRGSRESFRKSRIIQSRQISQSMLQHQ